MNEIPDTQFLYPSDGTLSARWCDYDFLVPSDILKQADFNAKSLIMENPIGGLLPINDKLVEELRRVFIKK